MNCAGSDERRDVAVGGSPRRAGERGEQAGSRDGGYDWASAGVEGAPGVRVPCRGAERRAGPYQRVVKGAGGDPVGVHHVC